MSLVEMNEDLAQPVELDIIVQGVFQILEIESTGALWFCMFVLNFTYNCTLFLYM